MEILDRRRTRRLFTLYNNHLKSQFVMPGDDPAVATASADLQRTRQAEMVMKIVDERMRPDGRFLVTGDMNDSPGSQPLQEFSIHALGLVDGLADPQETRPAKTDQPPPASKAWTHRFKESGQPARYELFDQIWLSPSLAGRQAGAFIDRRTRHGGDGSDHDPAWVVLDL